MAGGTQYHYFSAGRADRGNTGILCCRKALPVIAFLDKLAFDEGDLLVKQVVGLVNEAYYRIGDSCWVSMLEPWGVGIQVDAVGPVS